MPSLPDTVARTPPPSVLMAVTVAPAMGSLAEFLTIPINAPNVAFAAATVPVAVSGAFARAGCAASSMIAASSTYLDRVLRAFISGTSLKRGNRKTARVDFTNPCIGICADPSAFPFDDVIREPDEGFGGGAEGGEGVDSVVP